MKNTLLKKYNLLIFVDIGSPNGSIYESPLGLVQCDFDKNCTSLSFKIMKLTNKNFILELGNYDSQKYFGSQVFRIELSKIKE